LLFQLIHQEVIKLLYKEYYTRLPDLSKKHFSSFVKLFLKKEVRFNTLFKFASAIIYTFAEDFVLNSANLLLSIGNRCYASI